MLIACKCLNVAVDAKNEGDVVDVSTLNLSQEEESHSFFKEKVLQIDVHKVTVQVKSLIHSNALGNWVIETCINCSTNCYSTSANGSTVLANAALVTYPDTIDQMKTYKDYSPVFRIIVEPLVVDQILNSTDSRQSPQKIQAALSSLQGQLSDVMREQAIKTEERIRLFTEQQYNLLDEFRERATKDHRALTQRIYDAQPRLSSAQVVPVNCDVTDEAVAASPGSRRLLNKKKVDATCQPRVTPSQVSETMSQRSVGLLSKNSSAAANSLDSEGLFVLEGMEDSVVNEPGHSEGESDTDHDDSGSHDEGIDVHRKRTSSFHMAKSLPVSVPVYSVPSTNFNNDEESLGVVDIAASIKALARSVHGDAIFGDLPRPRFSTQI